MSGKFFIISDEHGLNDAIKTFAVIISLLFLIGLVLVAHKVFFVMPKHQNIERPIFENTPNKIIIGEPKKKDTKIEVSREKAKQIILVFPNGSEISLDKLLYPKKEMQLIFSEKKKKSK